MDDSLDLLQSSDDVLRTVVDGALAAVVVMDAGGRVRGWGPRAETTFGWPRAEAVGKELASLIVPPELREQHRTGIRRYLETGEPRVTGRIVELEGLRRDGTRIPVEISINPPVRHRQQVLFIAFLRDISERRLAEAEQARLVSEARQASEALRDLSSLVVHELRAPLTVILGYATMLAGDDLAGEPEQARAAARAIERQAAVANQLIDRLLLLARADAGALKPKTETLTIEELIRQATERGAPRAALVNGMVVAPGATPGALATGDREWTASILDNLVNNALIHAGAEPRVVIEASGQSIWVTDSGEGIAESVQAGLFDRFFQGRPSNAGGSGLGLHLSRRLARLQGGDLVLEPATAGQGARFRLDLAGPVTIATTSNLNLAPS